jgi:hypothetical protein
MISNCVGLGHAQARTTRRGSTSDAVSANAQQCVATLSYLNEDNSRARLGHLAPVPSRVAPPPLFFPLRSPAMPASFSFISVHAHSATANPVTRRFKRRSTPGEKIRNDSIEPTSGWSLGQREGPFRGRCGPSFSPAQPAGAMERKSEFPGMVLSPISTSENHGRSNFQRARQ